MAKDLCSIVDLAISLHRTGQGGKARLKKELAELGVNLDDDGIAALANAAAERGLRMTTREDVKIRAVEAELAKMVHESDARGIEEILLTIWRAGLLSSLRSAQASLFGNAVTAIADAVSDIPASAFDWMMSKVTGQRTKSVRGPFMRLAVGSDIKRAYRKRWAKTKDTDGYVHPSAISAALTMGRNTVKNAKGFAKVEAAIDALYDITDVIFPPEDVGEAAQYHDDVRPGRFDPRKVKGWGPRARAFAAPILGPLGIATNVVYGSIMAADRMFRGAAFRRGMFEAAYTRALSDGLKPDDALSVAGDAILAGGTPDLWLEAIYRMEIEGDTETALEMMALMAEAQEEVHVQMFTNDSPMVKALMEVSNIPVIGTFLKLIQPFLRVPTNVNLNKLEHTPVGLVTGVRSAIMAARAAKDNPAESRVLQKKAARALGRSTAGTTAGMMLAALAVRASIEITGAAGDSEEREAREARGRPSTSIKIGNRWLSLSDYPQLAPMVMAAAVMGRLKVNPEGDVLAMSAGQAVGAMMEAPAMRGIQSVARDMETMGRTTVEGDRTISEVITESLFAKNLAGSLVPTAVSDWGNADDPYARASRSVAERIRERLPATRGELSIRYDALGRPIERTVGAEAQIRGNVPVREEKENDPVAIELTKFAWSPMPKRVADKERVDRDRDEKDYMERVRRAGELFRERAAVLIASPRYSALTNEQKLTQLKEISRVVNREVTEALKEERQGR